MKHEINATNFALTIENPYHLNKSVILLDESNIQEKTGYPLSVLEKHISFKDHLVLYYMILSNDSTGVFFIANPSLDKSDFNVFSIGKSGIKKHKGTYSEGQYIINPEVI